MISRMVPMASPFFSVSSSARGTLDALTDERVRRWRAQACVEEQIAEDTALYSNLRPRLVFVLLSPLNFVCFDAHCVFAWFKCPACALGVNLREFSAEKQDLRRIVNPQ